MTTSETAPRPARSSRAEAVAWAASVAADRSAVFLDTETTGLGDDAEICDVAVVAVDGTVLLDTLVRPWRAIPEAATQVHGITLAMVLDAPYWEDVAPRLRSLLYGRRVIVYNAAYDAGVVNALGRRCFVPKQPDVAVGWECAMEAFAAYWGARRYRSGFKWWKLSTAAERLGVEPGTHRALADAETCRKVVLAMAEGGRR